MCWTEFSRGLQSPRILTPPIPGDYSPHPNSHMMLNSTRLRVIIPLCVTPTPSTQGHRHNTARHRPAGSAALGRGTATWLPSASPTPTLAPAIQHLQAAADPKLNWRELEGLGCANSDHTSGQASGPADAAPLGSGVHESNGAAGMSACKYQAGHDWGASCDRSRLPGHSQEQAAQAPASVGCCGPLSDVNRPGGSCGVCVCTQGPMQSMLRRGSGADRL